MSNVFESVLAFRGTWRKYQQRVLEASGAYLDDGKIHIVAAPGAGKTTLGIELIRRMGAPCLVLSPRIVIRQQWLERIQEAFLVEGRNAEDYLSNNIKYPKLITSITYQTLFGGMTKFRGTEKEEDSASSEEVDFSDFELVRTVKESGIKVICLDECHHLKNEWWKALENFMKEMENVTVIALTATPPYDSSPAQWDRYCSMCGPVDEEITVPELVKESSLCPHQDYVYFNYPSREEQEMADRFRERADRMYGQLMEDEQLKRAVSTHPALSDCEGTADTMLENAAYLSSLLIYCQAKKVPFSRKWMKLLGVKELPEMSQKWMEFLLQGFLYEDAENFCCEDEYREELSGALKAKGLVERKKISFLVNNKVEKALINSRGKLESIRAICRTEYAGMGEQLRMLILTDYIRKEHLCDLGDPERKQDTIGVVPIFELLRRENSVWKIGVLCGSLIILPDAALKGLEQAAAEAGIKDALRTKSLKNPEGIPLGYFEVTVSGRIHIYAQIVTQLFEQGQIQILIGTKSLLGEGWDSPCINALILASFVGSYVLSNQMRGRAIRTMAGNPEKTSNIWHLVCLSHSKELKEKKRMDVPHPELSEDYYILKRRMEGFFGVSYDGSSIESGIDRLSIIHEPYSEKHIKEINEEMLDRAGRRDQLLRQWKEAVFLYERMEVTEECSMNKESLKGGSFIINGIGTLIVLLVTQLSGTAVQILWRTSIEWEFLVVTLLLISMAARVIVKMVKFCSPLKRIKYIAQGVLKALEKSGQIKSSCRVETEEGEGLYCSVFLTGGTAREKSVFADCLEEMLKPVDNQRYLLHSKKGRLTMENFYCVPPMFSKTREEASMFQEAISSEIGPYRLIYTRNAEGRKLLLQARIRAFGSRNERVFDRKKKVKSALE